MKAARFEDKVVLITGGGNNIGRGVALAMAREGARVMIADADIFAARDTIAALQEITEECAWVRTDIFHEDQIARMRDVTLRTFGRVDVLINNVGGGGAIKPLTEMTSHDWDHNFRFNVGQMYSCCRHMIPEMLKTGGGTIVNTGTVFSVIAGSSSIVYTPAKSGIVNLTRHIAMYYGPQIRANCICPGHVLTPKTKEDYEAADRAERLTLKYRLQRYCSIEDLTEVYCHLASGDSAFTTGATVMVDGGYSIY